MLKKLFIKIGQKVVDLVSKIMPKKNKVDNPANDEKCESNDCKEECKNGVVKNACIAIGCWVYAIFAVTFPVMFLTSVWVVSDQLNWDWSRKFASHFPGV